ncbi:MAG: hypothetical protein K0S65_3978 [Labilithrix sp.]|nr:hypothetical protein [Labilithrix sp.]
MSKRIQVARGLRGFVLVASSLLCSDLDAGEAVPVSYRLLWIREDDAASCPGPSAVARGVRERLGYDPFRDDARAAIEAHVDRAGGTWRVSLRFSDGTREATKRFESPSSDCAAVAQAAELAISLAIQGNELARAESAIVPAESGADAGPPGIADQSSGSAAPTEASRDRPPPPPQPSLPAFEGMLAVSSVGALGLLPQPALGLDVHGLVRLRRGVFVSLGMAHVPEVRADDPAFRLGSTLGRVGACLDPTGASRPRLVGCAHVDLGSTFVVVRELTPTAPGSKVFGGVSAGILFVQPFRPFALLVEAEAMAPVPAYDLSLSGTGRVIYSSPFVSGFLRVGLGFGSF